jgi:hypothetical protein
MGAISRREYASLTIPRRRSDNAKARITTTATPISSNVHVSQRESSDAASASARNRKGHDNSDAATNMPFAASATTFAPEREEADQNELMEDASLPSRPLVGGSPPVSPMLRPVNYLACLDAITNPTTD